MMKHLIIAFFVCVELIELAPATKSASSCPTIRLQNGRVRYRQKGRFVKFSCNTGYIIAGEKYSTCHQGSWDGPLPKCVRASCVPVKPHVNGMIYPSHRGAVLNFFCKPGYDLRGPNVTYCDGRQWDNNLPACLPSNSTPPLSCDFESEDLCGWSHDLRHDFDWIRMNYQTPSGHIGTGPAYDHTKGPNSDGFYMYIESSSRNENDTARLISPIFDKMEQETCLEFYYHMYGISVGQLRVYIKKISDSWILKPSNAIFLKSGNHGNRWLSSFTRLGSIDEDFQVIFEGVRGRSYVSDIAIDDVKITNNCDEFDDTYTTTEESESTDAAQNIESCLNRCDSNISTPSNVSFQLSCDCDDACTDKNSCCPDYVVLCVLGVTDEISTTETISVTNGTTKPPTVTVANTKIPTTTTTPTTTPTTTTTTTTTTRPPTTKKPIPLPTPRPITTRSSSTTTATTTLITTRSTKSTVNVTMPRVKITVPPVENKTTITNPTVIKMLPTLVFLTTPSATTIMRRIIATVKMTDDELEVPVEPDWEDSTPKTAAVATFSKSHDGSSTFTIVIVATVSLLVFVGILIVVVVKRYRMACVRMGKMKNSNGDSQSDVRFLTSDEILDFNVARPHNYDQL